MGRRNRHHAGHQPVQHQGCGRRIRQGRQGADRKGDRRGEGRIPGLGALDAAGALRRADQDFRRNPRPQGRARPPARPRGGQDAPRGYRRGGARRADLCVLRRRSAAADGREGRIGAPRPRRRDHPRAGRRRRYDHAVELPDRDPGLEDRAGALLRQRRRVQAGGAGAGLGARAVRDHRAFRHSLRRVQPRGRLGVGGRPDPARSSRRRRDLVHRLGSDRPQDRAGLRALQSHERSSSSRWAARTRWSCSTTPT
ncbi:hypothetical protein ABIF29_006792 [Bradyrhizobium elkanii]|uniref:Uncharacterized protein n=1 Tax=Bradyrhizobium elkanii TaxID=29448 RepID=A0ABV4F961_BRAEL